MLSAYHARNLLKRPPSRPNSRLRGAHGTFPSKMCVRELQVPAFINSFPLARRILKRIGLGPKPPKVPTIEEFEKLSENEVYAWAVVGTRLPSPWNPSETLSKSLLKKLIKANHLQAKYTYATMVFTGSMRGDNNEAIQYWEECSRAGHSWAKSNLARLLLEGRVVKKDLERSAMLYEESWNAAPVLSEAHAHTAALNLADLYMNHLGRPKDGLKWLHRAADEAHDILAQYQLGHAYSYGKFGLPIDLEKAREYTQRAADGNLALAQHNLGCLLYDQVSVVPSQNSTSAAKDSAASAITEADPDYVGAAYYFSRAHQQEYYWSTLNLAGMYASGKGVPQNFVTAKILTKEVSVYGSEEQQAAAMDVLRNIEKLENGEEVMSSELQMKTRGDERNPSAPLNVGL